VPATDLSAYVGQAITGVGQARGAATQAADAVSEAVNRSESGDPAAGELEFDERGALGGSIPAGQPADVAATVREPLGDEPGR